MKVAVLSCFYPYRGGISQFNSALLGELGKTCETRAFNFSRQYPDILFPGKTQYVTPDDEAEAIESIAVLDTVNPLSYIKTYRTIRDWHPDLVIVRYWMSWFAPSLGFVTRRLRKDGITVISILDNVIPHERHFFDNALTGYFLGGSDGCVTLCDAVERDLKSIAPDKRSIVLYHPLYSHFGHKLQRDGAISGLGLNPERKTLLFFGLIRHYKGLDILLEAMAMLDDSYQLIIAGEPYGSFGPYQKIIDDKGLSERIFKVTSYIKDSQVKDYFSAADLCVLPYRSATQSGVSAISFHFEVPMLVTDTGGLKETIFETGTGLLADDCTPLAIKEKTEYFFSDPAIKENCISNIKVQKERLSWRNFARKLLEFAQNKD